MPVAASDFPFQLILLFVAGLIWAFGKLATVSRSFRHRTRMKMEQQERRRKMQFEERSEYAAPVAVPEEQKLKRLPVTPVRPPPRQKQRVVRRRVIRRVVPEVQPVPPAGIRRRLRDVRSLRDAIVLREILGPPKALRGRRMR